MAEQLADSIQRHSTLHKPARERVAQIMPAKIVNSSAFSAGVNQCSVASTRFSGWCWFRNKYPLRFRQEGRERIAESTTSLSGTCTGSSFFVRGTSRTLRVQSDVWEARDQIAKAEKINFRLLDIAIRTALICAAFDGQKTLHADDLAPSWALARYQQRVRALLQPNTGKNQEAQVALKILTYLQTHSVDGKFLKLRDVLTATHAYEYGPATCERVIGALVFGGDVEQAEITNTRGRKVRRLRRVHEGGHDEAITTKK